MSKFIKKAWNNDALIGAFNHLLESRFLFCGFMTGSYYTCHYRVDRKATPKWEIEKRYYEDRYRFESAFLAAFKGIERFFGELNMKEKNIPKILARYPNPNINEKTIYYRAHEIFSGLPEKVTYGNLLSHFLKLRNAAAAHGNKKPAADCILIEDHIFEIQLFLIELLDKEISK